MDEDSKKITDFASETKVVEAKVAANERFRINSSFMSSLIALIFGAFTLGMEVTVLGLESVQVANYYEYSGYLLWVADLVVSAAGSVTLIWWNAKSLVRAYRRGNDVCV